MPDRYQIARVQFEFFKNSGDWLTELTLPGPPSPFNFGLRPHISSKRRLCESPQLF